MELGEDLGNIIRGPEILEDDLCKPKLGMEREKKEYNHGESETHL